MKNNKSSSEKNLRPQTLNEYIGQKKIIQTLRLFVEGVKQRKFASEHLLMFGPPGIGKTTLAYVIANELKGTIKVTSGAAIQKGADLAAVLTNLSDNDILFIDEVHRLPKTIEEMLYPVLEEFVMDIIIGKGPSARTMRLQIPKITIIGATTKLALLSAPLRDRFGLILRLDYYNIQEMFFIVKRASSILNMVITDEAAHEIAIRSRKTPRIANRILKRARDLIEVHKFKCIDKPLLTNLFNLLDIDNQGLSNIDVKYLKLVAERFQNLAVGIETIASSLSEDKKTVEEFIAVRIYQKDN